MTSPLPVKSLRGLRACLVDDNATNRSLLQYHVSAWNMHHESAVDGPSALNLLRRAAQEGTPFDIAIVDVHMPEMNGLELCRLIKEDPQIRHTQVICSQPPGSAVTVYSHKRWGRRLSDQTDSRTASGGLHALSAWTRRAGRKTQLITSYPLGSKGLHDPAGVGGGRQPVNQRVAVKMLELGCRVDLAGTGIEALAAICRHPYPFGVHGLPDAGARRIRNDPLDSLSKQPGTSAHHLP